MSNEESKPKAIVFSNRKPLLNAARQALSEAKFSGPKQFMEKTEECLKALDETDGELILILDWDVGAGEILKVFEHIKPKANKEFFSTFLVATEQSEKIIAAGAENGVAKVHIGAVAAVKIKLAIDELLKDLKQSAPLKSLMKRIHEARQNKDWAVAVQLLTEIFKKDTTNRRVAYELAATFQQQKEWQQSYSTLEGLLSQEPADPRILHTAGKALIKLGKVDEAAALLSKADLINPFNVERLIELGNVLLTQNKVGEAAATFDRAKALDSDNKDAAKGAGTCKLLDGDINQALRLLKDQVSGQELASVFNTAAVLAMRQGQFPKGIDLYKAAENVLQSKKDILARILFNKGIGFYRWQKLEDAKKCFEEAVALDPGFENAKHNLKAVTNELGGAKEVKVNEVAQIAPAITFNDSIGDVFADALANEDERI